MKTAIRSKCCLQVMLVYTLNMFILMYEKLFKLKVQNFNKKAQIDHTSLWDSPKEVLLKQSTSGRLAP